MKNLRNGNAEPEVRVGMRFCSAGQLGFAISSEEGKSEGVFQTGDFFKLSLRVCRGLDPDGEGRSFPAWQQYRFIIIRIEVPQRMPWRSPRN